MMGVYIKGMEMPTSRPICVVIDAAGQARRYDLNNDRYADNELLETIPVPPHGRLIDADALPTYDKPIGKMMMFGGEYVYTQTAIDNAPTIIPTDAGKEERHGV